MVLACVPLALGSSACRRSQDPPEAAPAPARSTTAARPAPAPSAGGADNASSGTAGAPTSAEALSGDGLYLCTNKFEDQVVQRVALPTGQAFLISHGAQSWLTSEGESLEDEDLRQLERAFREAHFFDFPEHVHTAGAAEREWDLRFATHDRAHQAVSFQEPGSPFRELFAACDRVFSKLPTTRSEDVTVALAIYRTLEEYAKGMKRPDPRRQLLLDWLDSLQAEFPGQ